MMHVCRFLITCACLVTLFGHTMGRLRSLERKVDELEWKVNDYKYRIEDLEDGVEIMNKSLIQIQKNCTEESAEKVLKGTVKSENLPKVQDTNVDMQVFLKERNWIRKELSSLKALTQGLSNNPDLKTRTGSNKPIAMDQFDRRLKTMEVTLSASVRDEIEKRKQSVQNVETSLLKAIEHDRAEVSNKIDEIRTTCIENNRVILESLTKLEERLVALENNEKQSKHGADLMESTSAYVDTYMSLLNMLGNPLNTAPACEDGWKRFDDFCYQFRDERNTFSEAVTSCVRDNAYLVDIQSAVEEAFIDDIVTKRTIWLGSNERNTWMHNSSPMEYANWSSSERFMETRNGEVFAYKPYGRTWRTTTARLQFVCKKAL